jgi:peptide-methionine (S)-S-oxide reductase
VTSFAAFAEALLKSQAAAEATTGSQQATTNARFQGQFASTQPQAPAQTTATTQPQGQFATNSQANFANTAQAQVQPGSSFNAPAVRQPTTATAILSGGCFWGTEMIFEFVRGVSSSVSGYAGGTAFGANYEAVVAGNTNHAESVEIIYDPSVVSFKDLLRVFFAIHDPTQLNYQGPDQGRQYRSSVQYLNQQQKIEAEEVINEIRNNYGGKRVVTTVVPLQRFYAAEEYHQDFAEKNPNYGYLVRYNLKELVQLRNQFPDLFNEAKTQDPAFRGLIQAAFFSQGRQVA